MFILLNIKFYDFRVCSQDTISQKKIFLYEATDFWASVTSEKQIPVLSTKVAYWIIMWNMSMNSQKTHEMTNLC